MTADRMKARRRTLMILGGVAAVSVALGALAWAPPGAELARRARERRQGRAPA